MGPCKTSRNDSILLKTIHPYLLTMERNTRSNLIKLLFADDESVVSSTICEDPANQNQIQSQDELTNPNPSKKMDTSENDNVSILGSEGVAKKRSNIRKRYINSVYED